MVGCFGVVNASKRIPELLRATADVRREHPELTLLLVGSTSPGFDLDRRLQRLGLADDGLAREGWVDESRLWALMAGSDVLVNLRHPTMGETSGSVIRGLSLGKPLVVSDVGWFSELPGDVALKVAPDDAEVETLTAALELLAARADVREAMGAAAAELARREHDVGRVADLYASALESAVGGDAVDDAVLREVSEAAADVGHLGEHGRGERDRPPPRRGRAWVERSAGFRPGRGSRPSWSARRSCARSSARDLVAPFIMVDEIIWSEVARGIADAGEPLLRGEPDPGYSIVYPLLISPVYALFESLPDAYAGVKTLNALAHVARCRAGVLPRPARRARRPRVARRAHGGRDPVHGVHGTVMTENAFYPLFLLVALVLVVVLERPTLLRVALLLVLVGLAYATRVQAVALVPAILLAPFVLAAVRAGELHSDDLAVPLAVRDRRRRAPSRFSPSSSCRAEVCSAPTRRSASGRTSSARRFGTCGGTSPSSRSTCS